MPFLDLFRSFRRSPGFWSALLALAVLLVLLAALDPAGDHAGGWDGPGLSVDEPINVGQGVMLVDKLLDFDLKGFREVDSALTDYPPLGRIWIGLCHEFAFLANPPLDPIVPYSITCARVSAALLFALTIWWIGAAAARFWGPVAGIVSAVALVLMPRSFGHAHLANLETAINFAYTACVVFLCRRGPGLVSRGLASQPAPGSAERPPILSGYFPSAIGAGLLLGLAFSIKVQALFLAAAIGAWAILWLRGRAPLWLLILGTTAGLVFYAAWPWLWDAPLQNGLKYLGRTTDRVSIQAWYFGAAVADRDLPWHYPWVLFGSTVPLGLHLLGLVSTVSVLRSLRTTPRESLLAAGILVPLVAFSVPRIAVYDGERLFSVVFPLWAMLIGRGAAEVVHWLGERRWCGPRLALVALVGLLGANTLGLWQPAPAWLSYYNGAVGGLSGAVQLGMPASYWGDGLTRTLIARAAETIPEESTVAVAPTLYALQPLELERQASRLKSRKIRLVSFGSPEAKAARFVLVVNRPEYLPPELRSLTVHDLNPVVVRDGVWLAGLWRITEPGPP